MAITTLDGLIAAGKPAESILKAAFTGEVAGGFHSTLYLAGRPGAGVAPTPGLGGAALTSYSGQIPFPAAVGGQNVHLARFEAAQAANVGGVILADRLWHNSGFTITTTTAQTVNSVAFPARDRNGSTNGVGVEVGLEFSATSTNAAISNTTMSYTNDAGTAGRTATLPTTTTSILAGTFLPFLLAAGDTGVRSIQSLTLGTSYLTGTCHLVAYRRIAALGTPLANVAAMADGIALGLPRCYDGTVPWLIYQLISTAAGITNAAVTWAQG